MEAVDVTEALNISGGVATGSYTLDSQNTIMDAVPVYWIADGTTPLVPTAFTAVFSSSFTVPTNVTGEFAASGAGISFSGINLEGFAYAIPGSQSADIANVRLKCESSSGCQTFLSCEDGAGVSSFGEVGFIGGNATMTLQAADIEAVVGGPWSGRNACEILSSGPLTAQQFTRSNGVLVNNSHVVGRDNDLVPVPVPGG